MGNTCCDVRKKANLLPSPSSNPKKTHKTSASKPKKHHKQPLTKQPSENQHTSDHPNWKVYFKEQILNEVQQPSTPIEPAEDSDSIDSLSSDSSISIDYELNSANRMTMRQRASILEVMNQFQDLSQKEENFDSYTEATHHLEAGYSRECIIGITSHALYILNKENFAIVNKRIAIPDIKGFLIDEFVSSFLIVTGESVHLHLSSSKVLDIIKAVELISYENTGKVIPWKSEGTVEEVGDRTYQTIGFVDFKFNANIYIHMLEEGKLGETVLEYKRCEHNGFMMTEQSIYKLNGKYRFLSEMQLRDIVMIEVNEDTEIVTVSSAGRSIQWKMPVAYSEWIKNAAAEAGNSHITIKFL